MNSTLYVMGDELLPNVFDLIQLEMSKASMVTSDQSQFGTKCEVNEDCSESLCCSGGKCVPGTTCY